MKYKIVNMCIEHIRAISEIEKLCFSRPRSYNSLMTELDNNNAVFLTALDPNNTVMAYGGMNTVLDEAYVVNIAVHPDYRCHGIATAIVSRLIDYCKENNYSFITLEVRPSNTVARNLYTKLGFVELGERKDFYCNPKENAVIMTKYFN